MLSLKKLIFESFQQIKKFPGVTWGVIILDLTVTLFEASLDTERALSPGLLVLILSITVFGLWVSAITILSTWAHINGHGIRPKYLLKGSLKKLPPLIVLMLILLGAAIAYFIAAAFAVVVPTYLIFKLTRNFIIPAIILTLPALALGIYLYAQISLAWPILAVHGWETSNPFQLSRKLLRSKIRPVLAINLIFFGWLGVTLVTQYVITLSAPSYLQAVKCIVALIGTLLTMFCAVFLTVVYSKLAAKH